jgi:hypothetical protein
MIVNTCAGGNVVRRGVVVLSGSLQGAQAIKWEIARDSAGTTWVELERSTNTTVDDQEPEGGDDPKDYGSDGTFAGPTFYARHRVSIVDGAMVCDGPDTSTQVSADELDGVLSC